MKVAKVVICVLIVALVGILGACVNQYVINRQQVSVLQGGSVENIDNIDGVVTKIDKKGVQLTVYSIGADDLFLPNIDIYPFTVDILLPRTISCPIRLSSGTKITMNDLRIGNDVSVWLVNKQIKIIKVFK